MRSIFFNSKYNLSKTTSSPQSREIISLKLKHWIDQDWMSQILVRQYLVKHQIRILILNLISVKLKPWIDQGHYILTYLKNGNKKRLTIICQPILCIEYRIIPFAIYHKRHSHHTSDYISAYTGRLYLD